MKRALLTLAALSTTLATQASFAGFRFNHVIYDCTLDSQREVGSVIKLNGQIYEATPEVNDHKLDLQGQWLAAGEIEMKTGKVFYFGGSSVSKSWLNPDVVSIKERPEILGEEPTSLSLSLNLETLKGEVTYKKWTGYAPVGTPAVKVTAPITCSKADRYIN